MYSIPLTDNSKEIDLVVLRSLLALAGLAAFFYRANAYVFINVTIAVALLAAAIAVRYLFSLLRIKKLILLSIAALLLFIATHAATFSLLLVAFGMASYLIYKKPAVLLTEENVVLKSSKGSNSFGWDEFENIVLKDNLLTLDYKNNKLLQLEVDISGADINQKEINDFCRSCLAS